ncbi:MAG: hypothetical protein K0Q90_3241, partial [Paenibacillaceae bacterium]|nr:hypothetical protein [Paenibacillaceae bacterium]
KLNLSKIDIVISITPDIGDEYRGVDEHASIVIP